MRILYLSTSYVPSRRASGVQVMNMCAAFARRGHDVTLLTKHFQSREEPGVEDVFDFYGVDPAFTVQRVSRPPGRLGEARFVLGVARQVLTRRSAADLVYARDPIGAVIAGRARMPFVFEAHVDPETRFGRWLYRRILASPRLGQLVVISNALREILAERYDIPRHLPVTVAHDAAAEPASPHARRDPAGPVTVGYVGNLYDGRGIDVILEVARRLPELRFEIIGGQARDLEALDSLDMPGNVRLHGFIPPSRLAQRYAELDIVLLPHQARVLGASGRADISRYCSPLKLFEYMATAKAIVASDTAVFREVLRDGCDALLVSASDVDGWVRAVSRLARDPEQRQRLGQEARARFRSHHTWDARAAVVAESFERRAQAPAGTEPSEGLHA